MKGFDGARNQYQQYLTLSRALLSRDQENPVLQRNVAVGEASIASMEMALGELEKSATLQAQAASVFESLLDVDDAGSQFDWAAVTALGAEIACASGLSETEATLQDQLATIELTRDALIGRFRNRLLPLILKHLDAAAQRTDATQRSSITTVARQFAPN